MGIEWNNAHPELVRAASRRGYAKHKRVTFEMLGAWCNLCGETDETVLELDHKAPVKHVSRGLASGGDRTYYHLRTGKESPFNLQVLCANCHRRKTAAERFNFGGRPI
jgi:5-methylcytosine-specific restriction endonuclease McrA